MEPEMMVFVFNQSLGGTAAKTVTAKAEKLAGAAMPATRTVTTAHRSLAGLVVLCQYRTQADTANMLRWNSEYIIPVEDPNREGKLELKNVKVSCHIMGDEAASPFHARDESGEVVQKMPIYPVIQRDCGDLPVLSPSAMEEVLTQMQQICLDAYREANPGASISVQSKVPRIMRTAEEVLEGEEAPIDSIMHVLQSNTPLQPPEGNVIALGVSTRVRAGPENRHLGGREIRLVNLSYIPPPKARGWAPVTQVGLIARRGELVKREQRPKGASKGRMESPNRPRSVQARAAACLSDAQRARFDRIMEDEPKYCFHVVARAVGGGTLRQCSAEEGCKRRQGHCKEDVLQSSALLREAAANAEAPRPRSCSIGGMSMDDEIHALTGDSGAMGSQPQRYETSQQPAGRGRGKGCGTYVDALGGGMAHQGPGRFGPAQAMRAQHDNASVIASAFQQAQENISRGMPAEQALQEAAARHMTAYDTASGRAQASAGPTRDRVMPEQPSATVQRAQERRHGATGALQNAATGLASASETTSTLKQMMNGFCRMIAEYERPGQQGRERGLRAQALMNAAMDDALLTGGRPEDLQRASQQLKDRLDRLKQASQSGTQPRRGREYSRTDADRAAHESRSRSR